jgi:hypothetical protein
MRGWNLRVGFLSIDSALADGEETIVMLAAFRPVTAEQLTVSVNEQLLHSALLASHASRRKLSSTDIARVVRYRQALGITGSGSVTGLSGTTLEAASVGFAMSGLGLEVIAATLPLLGVIAIAIASAIEWNEVDLLRRSDDRVYVRNQVATASLIALLAAIGWAATAPL